MKKVTIQDIADALGISRNTVSKAINNSDGLADTTREQILEKAIEMGYEKVIVVTTRVDSYRMKHKRRPYAKVMYRKYPKFAEAFINRDKMYNNT